MLIGISMGDASGVGPEILLRSHQSGTLESNALIYGDVGILRAGADLLGIDVDLNVVSTPEEMIRGKFNVLNFDMLLDSDLTPGVLNKKSGAAARAYVIRAAKDALAGRIDALVTLPMNKEATQITDKNFCGHTELIAEVCDTEHFTLMLATPEIICSHVSTHVSMEESVLRCTRGRVRQVITITNDILSRFVDRPRIAVCGLNPHAGENGLFGTQEIEEIRPAVEDAQADGIDVEGPIAGDTAFYLAVRKNRYDAVVCQYHDQGHGPMKLLAFETGVNVTAGLPIIRTSVDHGTAFDIAWKGKAFTEGLDHAVDFAQKLIRN